MSGGKDESDKPQSPKEPEDSQPKEPKKSSKLTLKVQQYDKNSKGISPMFTLPLKDGLPTGDLAALRLDLIKSRRMESKYARTPFCTKDGSEVPDDTSFVDYMDTLEDDEKLNTKNVYLQVKKNTKKGLSEATLEFLKKRPDLTTDASNSELISTDVDPVRSNYNHKAWAADESDAKVVHPTDMSEKQWNAVFKNNSLLNGYRIRYRRKLASDGKTVEYAPGIERVMQPAFTLKPRAFETYELPVDVQDNPDDAVLQLGFRVPRFRLEDDSFVEVVETSDSLSKSMAESSFSKLDVEASVGGGAFGYEAAASIGFSKSEKEASQKLDKSEQKSMNISYNFPRVALELDEDSLELSPQCKRDLEEVADIEGLAKFHQKYGQYFPTRVLLGGKLHSSESSSIISGASVEQKANTMKAAASLSFSSPYVQASASTSYETQNQKEEKSSHSSLRGSVTWQAQGGDTLLCNNPPAWCSTVASFYNWRVVKQEEILPLAEMITKLPGYSHITNRFSDIANSKKFTLFDRPVRFKLQLMEANGKAAPSVPTFLSVAPWSIMGIGFASREVSDKENLQKWQITVRAKDGEQAKVPYNEDHWIHTYSREEVIYVPPFLKSGNPNKEKQLGLTKSPRHLTSRFGFRPVQAKDDKFISHGDEVALYFYADSNRKVPLKLGENGTIAAAFSNAHPWSEFRVKFLIV